MSKNLKSISQIAHPEIKDLRIRIDQVDTELLQLLELRADLVFQLGHLKKENNIPVHDPAREQNIKNKIRNSISPDCVLKPGEMESLFMSIVERYRFYENVHMRKDLLLNSEEKTLIDFNKTQTVILWGFNFLSASLYLALNNSLPHWQFRVFSPEVKVDTFTGWKAERQLENIDLINKDQLRCGDIYILGGSDNENKAVIVEFEFPKSSLVFDIGEGKADTVTQFQERCERKYESFTFFAGRPRVLSEISGFENADAALFYGKTFCWVTPNPKFVELRTQATFDRIAGLIGANPKWTDEAS